MAELLGISSSPEALLAAYRTAIDTYQISIVRFLYRVTGNLDLAANLAQEAFNRAYLHAIEQNTGGDLITGIYRSAAQTVIDYYTPKKSWLPRILRKNTKDVLVEVNPANEPAERQEVQRLLLTLPIVNRVCVALHFIEGFPYARISEISGSSLEKVRHGIYESKQAFLRVSEKGYACTHMSDLISAYVDREADIEQRSQVESHLSDCNHCRQLLEKYRLIRERLCSLWLTPPLPDIKVDTITRLQAVPLLPLNIDQRRKLKTRFRLSVFSSVSVLVVILVLPLVLHSDVNYNVTALISKVHAATDKVSTFKMDIETTEQTYPSTFSSDKFLTQWEFAGTDRFHYKDELTTGTITTLNEDIFVLGSDIYWNNLSTSGLLYSNIPIKTLAPTDLYDLLIPDYVIELKKIGNETINNVNCVHLRGAYNIEKYLLKSYAPLGIVSGGNNSYTVTVEGGAVSSTVTLQGNTVTVTIGGSSQTIILRAKPLVITTDNVIVDFWIGKDDCLIKKKVETIQSHSQSTKVRTTAIATSYLTYPGQTIVINPPLANDGSLLQNWQLYQMENGVYIKVK